MVTALRGQADRLAWQVTRAAAAAVHGAKELLAPTAGAAAEGERGAEDEAAAREAALETVVAAAGKAACAGWVRQRGLGVCVSVRVRVRVCARMRACLSACVVA